MIPLDQYDKWAPILEDCATRYLHPEELAVFLEMHPDHRNALLRGLLEKPIADFSVINEVYFRARWGEVISLLYPAGDLCLLEVASGDADMIPQAMATTHPNSRYITANMNKILNKSLLEKTGSLPLTVEIIEDDAASIDSHIGNATVDLVAFQHSVNDVIQAILCERYFVDTIDSDWMETLPRMIEILQEEVSVGTLEQNTKTAFLNLLKHLLKVLKKDGIIVMNHYMFQLDLDWGYPPALFENIIPMTRKWVSELSDFHEIFLEGFDAHWWLFLQKRH